MMKWIFRPITRRIFTFFLTQATEASKIEAKSIRRTLQWLANLETAQYVQENMAHVDSVTSATDLLDYALKTASLDGLFLEFGVYSGKSINHIASRTSSTVFGFDSFEGLPERWRDGFGKGRFSLKSHPKVRNNVALIPGWFNETLQNFKNEHTGPASFIHIDCDLYSSTKTILENLENQIIPGTVIVFDEYFNYPGWKTGEFKAFQEFVANKEITYDYICYNNQHEQVAIIIT